MDTSTIDPIGASELKELRDVVGRFLDAKAPPMRTMELMESGCYDPVVWRQMCDQLALPGLTVAAEHGGQGFGLCELAVVLEELGRVVYMGPLFATVLATTAIQLAGDDAVQEATLPALAAGEQTGALAVFEPGRGWHTDAPQTRAVLTDGRWRVFGRKTWVTDGATADLLVVSADEGLFLVSREDPAVTATPIPVLDLTRPMAAVDLDGAVATHLGSGDVLDDVRDVALVALACEQAGGARACVEFTTAYAAERLQFGRPIGSYQAVRHRLADMFVLAEQAAATAQAAAAAVATGDPEGQITAGVAASFCADAFLEVAAAAVQLHGGVGFTWEHPAHLYFKRAKASALHFGDPAAHRARIADRLLEGEAQL